MHRKNKTLNALLLSVIALLISSAFIAAPKVAADSSQQLTNDAAQLLGQVNVNDLPVPGPDTFPTAINLPIQYPNPQALLQGKVGQPQISKVVITGDSAQTFIHIGKSIAGTPGTNPNPCRCSPPDMGLAASTKYTVQMVNLAGTIYNNGGVALKTFSLADFWFLPVRGGPLAIGMSDPQVLFDVAADRFYASIIDVFDVNRVNFAVTATNNPLGVWYIYRVVAAAALGTAVSSHTLPDQPYIGYSTDKFLIAANDFLFDPTFTASSYLGDQYWVLNKSEMIAGNRFLDTVTNTPDSSHFSIRPAQHLSPTPTLPAPTAYLAENCLTVTPLVLTNICPATSLTTGGGINIFVITGTPPAPTTVTIVTVPISQTGFPPNADQPGHPASLATNDNRLLSVVWRNNLLWTA